MGTIVVTGAISGIGKATAKYCAAQGWQVSATMPKPENETELVNIDMASENAKPLSLKETPLKGKWILVIIGAVLMAIFFPVMSNLIDSIFQMIGF